MILKSSQVCLLLPWPAWSAGSQWMPVSDEDSDKELKYLGRQIKAGSLLQSWGWGLGMGVREVGYWISKDHFNLPWITSITLYNVTCLCISRTDYLILDNQLTVLWERQWLLLSEFLSGLQFFSVRMRHLVFTSPPIWPDHIAMSIAAVFIYFRCRQQFWWYFMFVTSDIPRTHNLRANSLLWLLN